MVRPVAFDLLTFLVPLAAGAGAFFAGRAFPRWPRAVQAGVVAAAVGVVAVGGLALARVLPDGPGAAFSRAGGLRVALGGAALLLLGVASAAPGRSFTPGFLRALAYLAGHRYGVGREPGLEAAGLRVDDHRLGGRDRRLAPGDQHQAGLLLGAVLWFARCPPACTRRPAPGRAATGSRFVVRSLSAGLHPATSTRAAATRTAQALMA